MSYCMYIYVFNSEINGCDRGACSELGGGGRKIYIARKMPGEPFFFPGTRLKGRIAGRLVPAGLGGAAQAGEDGTQVLD